MKTSADNAAVLRQIAGYWDQRAEGYSLQVDGEVGRQLQAQYLPWFEEAAAGGRVLDVGCGPGFFSVMLAARGFAVTAFDASRGMLQKAAERARKAGAAVETVLGDAQNLPFAEAAFDCVCSRNLVWNLQDPQQGYREWLRVLKPGGLLLVFDGNHYSYLFDERYARVHRPWNERSDHQMLGVDGSIIDNIAAGLPLSRAVRPGWDAAVLEALGAAVQTKVLKTVVDPQTGETLVTDFVVKAVKKGG